MATKTLPLSVRVTQDDAEFIANLEIPEAVTPSDKIRAIIRQAKDQIQGPGDNAEQQDLLESLKAAVRSLEVRERKSSDLVQPYLVWLMDNIHMLASLNLQTLDLESLEKDISKQIFRLFKHVARLAITEDAPCYDPDVLELELKPLLDLTDIIKDRRNNHD